LIGASEKEGFCVASGGEVFGGGIAFAEEDCRAASDEEERLWKAMSLMMASFVVVVASDEGEGFGMVAAAKAGLGFCAPSEEEGFVEAMMNKAEVGAAAMAGLGMVAAAKAGLEFIASSEEEGFKRATEMKGETGAATKAGFGRNATAKAGFGFFASSEEEGFARAMEMKGEVGATTMAGFGEASGSLMGVSTEAEVADRDDSGWRR
jgi:hypothetical protein